MLRSVTQKIADHLVLGVIRLYEWRTGLTYSEMSEEYERQTGEKFPEIPLGEEI